MFFTKVDYIVVVTWSKIFYLTYFHRGIGTWALGT